MGVEPDEKVALFADNSCRWLVADQGLYSISYSSMGIFGLLVPPCSACV